MPFWRLLGILILKPILLAHLKLDDVMHLVAGQVQLDAVINLQAQDGHDNSMP